MLQLAGLTVKVLLNNDKILNLTLLHFLAFLVLHLAFFVLRHVSPRLDAQIVAHTNCTIPIIIDWRGDWSK